MKTIRVRCRVSLLAAAIFAAALLLFVPRVWAQDMPPGMPADIQAILQKAKAGQVPSAADMKKLQDYFAQVQATHGQTSATTTNSKTGVTKTLTIPCNVISSESWHRVLKSGNTTTTTNGSISVSCQAQMVVAMHGNGDYFKNQFNPKVACSMFTIQPQTDAKGQPISTGSGSVQFHTQATDTSQDGNGQGPAACSGYLTTTGTDALYVAFQIGADYRGKVVTHTKDKDITQDNVLVPNLSCPLPQASVAPKIVVGQATPQPMMPFSYSQLANAIKNGTTATLSSGASFDYTLGTSPNTDEYSGNSTLIIVVNPPQEKMIIEPGQPAVYEKWLPIPDADSSQNTQLFGSPQPLSVHIAMLKSSTPAAPSTGPTQPTATVGGTIDIKLDDVLDAKGVCMNYPKNAQTQKSLYFPKKQPVGIKYIDDQHVQTIAADAREAWVFVACRDAAAYGTVTAQCKTLGLTANCQKTNKPGLLVPEDDNNNHIADAWEKTNNIYDDNYAPDWDHEDQPSGWKTNGDGITLFEEYRGFLVDDGSGNESFQRLKPGNPKKLFVYLTSTDQALHKQGVQLYQQATGVQVIYIHGTNRMDNYGSTLYPRWVNFNTTLYSNVQQCAVWIDDVDNDNPGSTFNEKDEPQENPQDPQTTWKVNVSRSGCVGVVNVWAALLPPLKPLASVSQAYQAAAQETQLNLTTVGSGLQARIPTLVNELIVFVTLHELGHATGGRHHALDQYLAFNSNSKAAMDAMEAKCFSSGDRSCPMRYWHFDADKSEILLFMSGKWDLTTPAAGGTWTFCDDDLPNMRIHP